MQLIAPRRGARTIRTPRSICLGDDAHLSGGSDGGARRFEGRRALGEITSAICQLFCEIVIYLFYLFNITDKGGH